MISASSAIARMAASFTLALAVRQKARSVAINSALDITPEAHRFRRCRASSSRRSMAQAYHGSTPAEGHSILFRDEKSRQKRRLLLP
jgi:hypothetical protein